MQNRKLHPLKLFTALRSAFHPSWPSKKRGTGRVDAIRNFPEGIIVMLNSAVAHHHNLNSGLIPAQRFSSRAGRDNFEISVTRNQISMVMAAKHLAHPEA